MYWVFVRWQNKLSEGVSDEDMFDHLKAAYEKLAVVSNCCIACFFWVVKLLAELMQIYE